MIWAEYAPDFASAVDELTAAQDLEAAIHAATMADAQMAVARAATQLSHAAAYYDQQGDRGASTQVLAVRQALLGLRADTLADYQAALYAFQQQQMAGVYRAAAARPLTSNLLWFVGGSLGALWIWDRAAARRERRARR